MFEGTIPLLETNRLILRSFKPEDAGRVQLLAGKREVARNTLAMPFPYHDGMAEAWIENHERDYQDGKSAIYAIVLKENRLLIGAIGLSIQLQYQLAELGYWIGEEYWGNGYCTEAAKAIINFGFAQLRLHKIHASHFGNNPASGRVLQKAGLTYEGTLKSHLFHWNEFKDLLQYGIWSNDL